MNFAIICAGGPMVPDEREGREFPKPRGLLSLGEETVVERLVRQARDVGFKVFVGINAAGDGGWTTEHINEFQQFDCQLYMSPATRRKLGSHTIAYLLEQVLKAPDLEDDSIVLGLYGDWVYSGSLFREILLYQRPCAFTFHGEDWNFALNGKNIRAFLELLQSVSSGTRFFRRYFKLYLQADPAPDTTHHFQRGPLGEMGFRLYKRYAYWPERFVEIDWLSDWEMALDLVAMERGGA